MTIESNGSIDMIKEGAITIGLVCLDTPVFK